MDIIFGKHSEKDPLPSFDEKLDALEQKGKQVTARLIPGISITDTHQKAIPAGRKEDKDALQRANDALQEVHFLLDNPLYNSTLQGPVHTDKTQQDDSREEPQEPKEPEKDPVEELDSLVGLQTIKYDVRELADFIRIQKMRKDEGLKSVPVSLHLVFTGNPGTGKTTVARILARLYKQIGVLTTGQLVEVDRSSLVAGYMGQTAVKTAKKIEEARGGILFIDEAYTLARKDDTFGQEAIDTILKAMEDNREDLVVIVAGYTGQMEDFINSNPGLKSRFNKYIDFPDYTVEELMEIFETDCKKYDYVAGDDVMPQIRAMIIQRKHDAGKNYANARDVRNLFEEIITNQAQRVAAMDSPGKDDMERILPEDLVDTQEEGTV